MYMLRLQSEMYYQKVSSSTYTTDQNYEWEWSIFLKVTKEKKHKMVLKTPKSLKKKNSLSVSS